MLLSRMAKSSPGKKPKLNEVSPTAKASTPPAVEPVVAGKKITPKTAPKISSPLSDLPAMGPKADEPKLVPTAASKSSKNTLAPKTPKKPKTSDHSSPVVTIPDKAEALSPRAPKSKTSSPAKPPVKLDLAAKPAPATKKAVLSKAKTKRPVDSTTPPPPPGKRILFIASECTPLAQSGGLGDVVAGLSKALRMRGHDARIVMPLYGFIDRARYGITFSRSCCVHFGEGEEIWVGIHEAKLDGVVPIWFIDYGRYFGGGNLYGEPDDAYRFGVLSKAALQVCKDTGYIPHVVHVHDWMTAMSAVFLKTWDRVLSPLSSTASVLTIHNIGYQGKFDPSVLRFYGLGGDYLRPDRLEDFGGINLLKAGIQYSDAITTVSPSYAREIREPIGGMGLAPYLNNRADHLFGILNGVDTTIWDTRTDKFLPARYSAENMAGKAECKRILQERFGLKVDPKIPLFGVVSRFAPQKGFDLLRGALPQAMRDMVMQFVALGTGDPITESFLRWMSDAFPGRANAHIGFSPELAHLIEAGCDFFLMPSLYEPCGLNQMYSSLYGALPIVRATGGLEDTVENYNEGTGRGTGFKFWEVSDRALYYTIGWAVSTWFDRPHHYLTMQKQGMACNFTWDASAQKYEDVYAHALVHRTAH
jgi:starch synthase